MKLRIAMCLIVFAFAAWPQSDVQPGSQPSPMEAFANTQGARIIWFNEVGRMEHDGRSVPLPRWCFRTPRNLRTKCAA